MKFRTKVLQAGKTATGVEVPAKVVDALGSKRPKVKATINGYTYRSSVAPMSGTFMLGISADVREAAGVKAGDTVTVDLELDTEARKVTVPPDFASALKKDAAAKRFFEGLSFSNQRWFVENVEGAKKAETRTRRIEAAVARLHEGRGPR
jgi:hypothetical protein